MWQLVDSWCPKGIRSAWGRSVKCLGLIAGVSVRRLIVSPYCLFCHSSQFSSRSRAFGKGKETAATQASGPGESLAVRICRLVTDGINQPKAFSINTQDQWDLELPILTDSTIQQFMHQRVSIEIWCTRKVWRARKLCKGLVNKYRGWVGANGGGGGGTRFWALTKGGVIKIWASQRGWVIIFVIQFNKFNKNKTSEQHSVNCSCITSLFLLRVWCD